MSPIRPSAGIPVALSLSSRIAPGTAAPIASRIAEASSAGRDVVLFLDSGGGDILAALDLEQAIRRASSSVGIRTHIGRGGRCMSACVVVFAAGHPRTASPDSVLMIHAARPTIRLKSGDIVRGPAVPEFSLAIARAIGAADPIFARHLDSLGVFTGSDREYRSNAAGIEQDFPDFLDLDD